MKILLVESDPATRRTLNLLLTELGHEVLQPEESDSTDRFGETIRFLNAYWPDAILMNFFLEGTTAPQVCDEILDLFGEMPTTLIHSPVAQHRFFALRYPDTAFLCSPFSPEELQAALEEVITTDISLTG